MCIRDRYRKRIPDTLNVISVARTDSYDSDGLVQEESVQAGKYIYQKQVNHYTTMTDVYKRQIMYS